MKEATTVQPADSLRFVSLFLIDDPDTEDSAGGFTLD